MKKLKEQGLKPKKKQKHTKPGNDECRDDISRLGKDTILLLQDAPYEVLESSDDDFLFTTVPITIHHSTKGLFSAVAHLQYGKYNAADLFELCGGEGRISEAACRRRFVSGGNLDLVTGCDLGDPMVQKAINHYLDTCYVLATVLQPNCRSTCRNSYFNIMMKYDIWNAHHQEDLPHLQYCGQVALKQTLLLRLFLRESNQSAHG